MKEMFGFIGALIGGLFGIGLAIILLIKIGMLLLS